MNQNPPTPAQLGFRLPGEWELHAATWLAWPHVKCSSYPDSYEVLAPAFTQFIKLLAQVEEVNLCVSDAEAQATAAQTLERGGVPLARIQFHTIPTREPWLRDFSPHFVTRESQGRHERLLVDWDFNGWGSRVFDHSWEDAVPGEIAKLRQMTPLRPHVVLESGAIDVNGRGSVLTTESCLLNSNRNPTLSQKEVAQALRDYLGVTNVLWLEQGLYGDDADGQVDAAARFINPTTLAVVVEEDLNDANYPILQENLRRLRSMRDQDGKLLRMVKLPTPGVIQKQAQRLPASYAHFYIANGLVVVPTFRHRNDAKAIEVLQKEFPYHRVVGFDASDLVWRFGSLHRIAAPEPV